MLRPDATLLRRREGPGLLPFTGPSQPQIPPRIFATIAPTPSSTQAQAMISNLTPPAVRPPSPRPSR